MADVPRITVTAAHHDRNDAKPGTAAGSTLPHVGEKQHHVHQNHVGLAYTDEEDEIKSEDRTIGLHVHEGDAPPLYDIKSGDPIPVYGDEPEETSQFTWRACIVGCLLGSTVQGSNLYLGLKSGFTFGPQLFGAIFGFAVLKFVSKLRWFGGHFGPKENCTVQTAATAAGGLGVIFVGGVPTMYTLNLLDTPSKDIGKLILFTLSCAFFGMAFAIPMRKHYILKQKLVFPTPTATALTIRSLHTGRAGEIAAGKKLKMLVSSFIGAVILKVASGYAPGILWDWHVFWWIALWGSKRATSLDNWTWIWENTPAFWGAGILSGVNASWSFFGGQVLGWGIIGPMLVKTGHAFGSTPYPDEYPHIHGYGSMSAKFTTASHPSPRYWLLWAGVMIMVVASFTELAMSGKNIVVGLQTAAVDAYHVAVGVFSRDRSGSKAHNPDEDIDKVPLEDRVPTWLWSSMLLISVVLTCLVMGLAFHVNVGVSIFAIVLGYLFSFIGVQSAGDTDINPISTVAKASQLVIGGTTHGYSSVTHAQSVNLLSGLLAAAAASQTTEMTGDLKTGHLLNAKPKNQFYAQAIGSLCAVFLAPGLFVVFTEAYPCIIDMEADKCQFATPSVGAWRAVAVAVTTKGDLPIPKSSWITGLILSVVGAFLIIARVKWVPENKRHWFPNLTAVGLGFILNTTVYGTAMATTSLLAYFWKEKYPGNYDMYAFALAAGLMAGEGVGGIVAAILTIAGIDGSVYGTAALCPAGKYCG